MESPEQCGAAEDDQRGDPEEQESKVYMSCITQGSKLGVAYYEVETGDMYVLDAWEDGDFPSVELLKYQAQPAIIYTSTKMEEAFLDALRRPVEGSRAFELKLVKSSFFSYEQAWNRLSTLELRGMQHLLPKERIHYLNSVMDLENEMQVRAAGGLIASLQQELLLDGTDEQQDASASHVEVHNIHQLSLNGFLNLDALSYDALQIFQTDNHPSFMGIGKAKEGFSVFGMLNKCLTLMGRRLLRTWFLRPILDLETLSDRLNTISVLKESKEATLSLQCLLKQVKNVSRVVQNFASPSFLSTSADWSTFLKSVNAIIQIRQLLSAFVTSNRDRARISQLNIVRKIFAVVSDELIYIADLVKGIIDFNQILGESSDTVIAYGICQELDELKTLYEGLPDFLDEIATAEMKKLTLQKRGSLMYIPQVGYFMCFSEELHKEAAESLPDFQLAFKTGCGNEEEFFYTTSKTKELDTVLGDIYNKILDMERAILKELEAKVLNYEPLLVQAAKVVAELDCLVSLAISACEYNYNRPELVSEDILEIKNGRHALQEMTVDTFVPNDTSINGRERINVITGPNYSGKSVYIKQVALIVFLAHIGSFVPADEARVGLTDRIFTRLPCKRSAKISQSTFMVDLHQIAVMLRYATSKSLCLIDEFGSGTVSADGVGLLCSAIHYFSSMTSTPKVLACTHFSELGDETFLPKSPKITFGMMSVLEPKDSCNVFAGEIVFLYRLVPGYQALSYGLYCAELAGVPQDIINRAAIVLESIQSGQPIHRLESSGIIAKDRQYKALVDKLIAFNCDEGDMDAFISDIKCLHTGLSSSSSCEEEGHGGRDPMAETARQGY